MATAIAKSKSNHSRELQTMFPIDLSVTHIMGALTLTALILLAVAAPTLVPVARILRRVGLNPWLGLVYVLPLVGLVALWIFAGTRWPNLDGPASSKGARTRA